MDKINEMYNAELKERFLSNYSVDVQRTYGRVFVKSASLEEEHQKDLYSFSLPEIEDVMTALAPSTIASARMVESSINVYINWAIQQKITNFNALDLRDRDEGWLEQFVTGVTHITDKELMLIEDYCLNAQDAVLFRLLFEGAGGRKLSEISNLKVDGVNFTNSELRLRSDNNTVRFLKVSERCVELIKEAIESDIYYKVNGEADLQPNQRPYLPLLLTKYVVRSAKSGYDNHEMVQQDTIIRRIKSIAKMYNELDLTPKLIQQSGMLYMAKTILDKNGVVTDKDYKMIAKRFGIKTFYYLKEIVSEENVRKTYRKENW